MNQELITTNTIERIIYYIRDQRVMLDHDLAEVYGVETRVLIQAVKRNVDRFPGDFMFQLSHEEFAILKSQIVISSSWGGRRKLPYAFTEQGVAMLSGVLNSPRAIQANIEIMRTFVKLRVIMASNAIFMKRLDDLEEKYDKQFKIVFDAIRQLMTSQSKAQRQIGFKHPKKNE